MIPILTLLTVYSPVHNTCCSTISIETFFNEWVQKCKNNWRKIFTNSTANNNFLNREDDKFIANFQHCYKFSIKQYIITYVYDDPCSRYDVTNHPKYFIKYRFTFLPDYGLLNSNFIHFYNFYYFVFFPLFSASDIMKSFWLSKPLQHTVYFRHHNKVT